MEYRFFLKNRDEKKISVSLMTPAVKTSRILILCNGFRADKDYDKALITLSKKASIEGIASLRFDFIGSGESDGRFVDATVSSEVQDLKDVIKFAHTLGYTQIIAGGRSLGAMVSLLAYDAKGYVLLSPALDLHYLYERYEKSFSDKKYIIRKRLRDDKKVRIGRGMWQEFGKVRLVQSIDKPTLVVYTEKDVHYARSQKYFKLFKDMTLRLLPGEDHDFIHCEEKVTELVIDWLRSFRW